MIPLSSIQRTAEDLMAKAAIEIPDDYLDGLRRCADTEKGDLSAFAEHDRLGMAGTSIIASLLLIRPRAHRGAASRPALHG